MATPLDDLLAELAISSIDRDAGLHAYADQLIERGDPFGELIVVALERSQHDSPELARREAELIAEIQQPLDARIDVGEIRWRLGFLDAITVHHHFDEPCEVLPVLAAAPHARMLRRIVFEGTSIHDEGDMAPVIAKLAELAPRFPRLVELGVHQQIGGDPFAIRPIDIHDVTPIYTAYPRLEVLELHGHALELGAVELPALRELSLKWIGPEHVRPIVTAAVPRLEHLVLHFDDIGTPNTLATYGPLLFRDFGTQLTSVSLRFPLQVRQTLLVALPTCPLVRHAKRLAFPGELDESFFHGLIEHAAQLDHVERLELDGRFIEPPMRRRLARRLGPRLALT